LSATASAEVHGPGGLFGFLPGVRLHAVAVAAEESGATAGGGAIP